jgi:vacuolar-type H+-ATPase subunit I/STV1
MKIKHKLLSDFQYISPDKKIFIIKAGTVLESYNYKLKSDIIPIDKEIVDANPEIFNIIDWKAELLTYIKTNKLPTPAVLTKKLIPFIEEIVLSSTSQIVNSVPIIDESKIRELDLKELDLNSRERRIKDQEDEIEIRLKRVEKKEKELKTDLLSLENKEDELRNKSKELIDKSLDIDDKLQDINERERNIDRNVLKSSKEIDSKYKELQDKIDNDLKSLSEKEKEFESNVKSLSKKEDEIAKYEDSLNDSKRVFAAKLYELNKFIGLDLTLNYLINEINGMLN